MENSVPLPIPASAPCCLGSHTTIPPMEEIAKELAFICKDLNSLLREADEGRARDLQEGSFQSVVRSPPRLGSEIWRRLNGIHRMCLGPGRREQRATRSRPYIRRDTSRHLGELQSPGEPGGSSRSSPLSGAGAIDTALLRGDEGVPPISSGRLGLVLRGEELIQLPGAELGIWVCDPLEDWPL